MEIFPNKSHSFNQLPIVSQPNFLLDRPNLINYI